jgi:predicted Zn-dependent protease with MMP-like domain
MVKKRSLSRKRFEYLVRKTLSDLPEEFKSKLENIAVFIEDEPPADMPDTLGLYEGVPLTERSLGSVTFPDRITLFKSTIERSCRTDEEIETEVRLTVLHEIGHFFGLDEEQME